MPLCEHCLETGLGEDHDKAAFLRHPVHAGHIHKTLGTAAAAVHTDHQRNRDGAVFHAVGHIFVPGTGKTLVLQGVQLGAVSDVVRVIPEGFSAETAVAAGFAHIRPHRVPQVGAQFAGEAVCHAYLGDLLLVGLALFAYGGGEIDLVRPFARIGLPDFLCFAVFTILRFYYIIKYMIFILI